MLVCPLSVHLQYAPCAGMLSKSRGHVLRLAAVFHMLFCIELPDEDLDDEIPEVALKAAVNFVQVACQQTAYMAGKGLLTEEVDKFKTSEWLVNV